MLPEECGMLLGIDVGTTILKAGLFDTENGNCLAFRARPLPLLKGAPEAREQDPLRLLRFVDHLISQLRYQTGSTWKTVKGIALATQGGSTLIVDRDSGTPKMPMILWNDPRAFPEFQRIRGSRSAAFWRSFSLRDEPGMGLARIAHLKKSSPELFTTGSLYIGAGEFIYHHLTGEWRQDPCHALQTGCYDGVRNCLTDLPLEESGIDLSFFAPLREDPPVLPLSVQAARRMHLSAGIPVYGPFIDQEGGYLSVQASHPAPLQLSLGTAWVGNFVCSSRISGRSPFQLAIPAPGEMDRLIIQPLLTGNMAWDWALRTFIGGRSQKALCEASNLFEHALLPKGGLIALPWLNRPNPIAPHLHGGLSFSGAGPNTDPGDFLRAVALGLVYELRRVFEDVCGKGLVECVVLSGGAGKGMVFQQLITHLFSPLKVLRVLEEDLVTTRGCLWFFKTPASSSSLEEIHILEPNLKPRIDELYQQYLEIFSRIHGGDPSGMPFQIDNQTDREESHP